MQQEAYAALHRLDSVHWWFVGARYIYRSLLEIGLGNESKNPRMLEVGCGSGGNLSTLSAFGPTVGLDVSSLALAMIKVRPQLGLVQAKAEALPFSADSFDSVNLWGVIEHLEDDLMGLREAWRVSRPNGTVTLLTSALPALWSHHDEANLHKRRYVRNQLADLLRIAHLLPIRLTYQNFFAFFPTLVIRFIQRFFVVSPKYDMGPQISWINTLMIKLLKFEALFIKKFEFPIGVDLIAVCRVYKKNSGNV